MNLEITPFCCDMFLISSECLQPSISLANHHINKVYHLLHYQKEVKIPAERLQEYL